MTTKVATKTATMDTKVLREALQKVSLAIPKRTTLPICTFIHTEFADGKAYLTATDLERAVRIAVDSTNSEHFSVMLPKKSVEKFLHGANGKVKIEVGKGDGNATLSREGLGDFKVFVPQPKDFPPIPQVDNPTWQKLDGKWFCRMLGILATACATELSRPVLTSVCCSEGKMASADGFRLVYLNDKRLTFGLGDKKALIPIWTILLAQKLFNKDDEIEVAFDVDHNQGYFKSPTTYLVTQLTQGNYPDYNQLIPQQYNCKISFSAPLLSQRLQMIDEKQLSGGIIRYQFHRKEDTKEHECFITAHSEELFDYSMTMPVKILSEDVGKIAFNHKYVVDAIKPFSMCNLEITSLSSPGKFTGDIEGLTITVMPMFVQW